MSDPCASPARARALSHPRARLPPQEMWPCGQAGTPELFWADDGQIVIDGLCVSFQAAGYSVVLEECVPGGDNTQIWEAQCAVKARRRAQMVRACVPRMHA